MEIEIPATDHKVMRDINQNRLLNLIRLNAPISRPELSALSGLSPATVLALTKDLVDRQIVVENGTAKSLRGRHPTLLEIHPEGGYAIGLMVREHEMVGAVVNLHGSIVTSLHWCLNLLDCQEEVIERIATRVEALIAHAELSRERITGVGCAISGYIDSQSGICIDSWQLGWHDFALGKPLSRRLKLPVMISNNVSCISCYETLFGHGQAYQNFLTVAMGRGLGLGIVIDGDIHGGATGGAGEFGHTVVVVGGRRCECGHQGCLEAYVAYRGILATYAELLAEKGDSLQKPTIEQILQAGPEDRIAAETLRQTGYLLGIGLANIVNLFNPECIILTGEGIEFGDRLFEPALRALQEHTFSQLGRRLQIVFDPWVGYESWARGAGALVLRRLFFIP